MMQCKKPSSSSSSSAAIIGGNDDLLLEILFFLPAKPLIRFQLVSKHWQSLISDPSFPHLHTLRHHHRRHPPASFLLQLSTNKSQYFYFSLTSKTLVPFDFPFLHTKIVNSSHGLLLLECRNTPHGRKDYYVGNPTINQFRKLPIHGKTNSIRQICLACEPFMTAPYTYKVVCFRGLQQVEIYDSKTHKWETIHNPSGESYNMDQCNVIYWKGGVYWMRPRHPSFCFDILEMGFHRVKEPPRVEKTGSITSHFMESNGHMYYMVLSSLSDENSLFGFELDKSDFGEYRWYKKYCVNLDPCLRGKSKISSFLGMVRGDRGEEDSIFVFDVPCKIMVYKVVDEVFEVLVDFRREGYYEKGGILQFGFKDTHQFVETLVSV